MTLKSFLALLATVAGALTAALGGIMPPEVSAVLAAAMPVVMFAEHLASKPTTSVTSDVAALASRVEAAVKALEGRSVVVTPTVQRTQTPVVQTPQVVQTPPVSG